MKKILGLDLGTNSIGWALINSDFNKKEGEIIGIGSRIIPMSQDILGAFDAGQSISQTAKRTEYRGKRRLYERDKLRRERLHRVLNILGYLPKHYSANIDFEKHYGQFKKETKLNYIEIEKGKFEFIFNDSFKEMVNVFRKTNPDLFYINNGTETKIPYDWTIYYLRKKALTERIGEQELAWILLNFNQKRGYYQLRGEEEEDATKLEQFFALKVLRIEQTEDNSPKGIWYNVHLEGGLIYRRQSKEPLDDWLGTIKEFIITTSLDKKGDPKEDKEGNIKQSFRAVDSEKDWIAIKKKTEKDIHNSHKEVGTYIFDSLLINPKQKINGKLIKTIERKYYKQELNAILERQKEFHPSLTDKVKYKKALEELYPRNEAHQQNLKDKDYLYLFMEDIIFYQRPLKSKKSTISNCPYESVTYFSKEGEKVVKPLKCTSKSNPIFQEFRLWQFIQNLKIYKQQGNDAQGKVEVNQDVTSVLLHTEEAYVDLFDFLNNRKEIDQNQLLKYFSGLKIIPKQDKINPEYFWNYIQDKSYPCNETKAQFISRLSKIDGVNTKEFLNTKVLQELWHIVYSVKDKHEFEKALGTFAKKKAIDENLFVEAFKKMPPYKNDYGAYSEKVLKKLLPLMRMGKYWVESNIPNDTKQIIADIQERLKSINYDEKRIEEVIDDAINKQLLKSFKKFKGRNALEGLNTYQACYAVYQRHSEISIITKWNSPIDIENYLKNIFKQHQLKNPIVEQVCTETLRLVKDIWDFYGKGEVNYFDEIHVELGREMKNPADKRKRMSEKNSERENTNLRIKALLEEMALDAEYHSKPRAFSPSHQEILKVYEEGVFYSTKEVDEEILKIRQTSKPSKAQINKYKLWLEQGYISPYTLSPIPLSRLFTEEYQIEHIIPQSRYFDNSMQNKIICESVVNEEKDNLTAYEFINQRGGETFDLGKNRKVQLLKFDAYEAHCSLYFKKNKIKLRNLLADEIPTGFIQRQLNDSRYISKYIKGLLSNIVREEGENQATAKNVVTINGAITSKLRQDWGLNDKWNELVAPRFKRLNDMYSNQDYGFWDKKINAFRIQVPNDISKGFSKKRIDHRHHALDALVVACITKDHVNYISSLNTERKNYSLVSKLRQTKEIVKNNSKTKQKELVKVASSYHHPWNNFTIEAKEGLEQVVVSFKQNLRVINRTNNKYLKWELQLDGTYKKKLVKQKRKNFAIRKPLHRETVSGLVSIKRKKKSLITLNNSLLNLELIVDKAIKKQVKKTFKKYSGNLKLIKKHLKENPIKVDGNIISKVEIYEIIQATATRTALSSKFTQKQLEAVTDSGIKSILQNHVNNYENDFEKAFSPEGLEVMNENIVSLNNGKNHQPIRSVRLYEVGSKFAVSENIQSSKSDKYVETAKGTNLFFAIYWDNEKKRRNYETVPLNVVIAHQMLEIELPMKEKTPIPLNAVKGQFLFTLSPNDLVYVPTEDEIVNPNLVEFNNLSKEQTIRVYKMVSCTGGEGHFTPLCIASEIVKNESGTNSKSERVQKIHLDELDEKGKPKMIKSICWKLIVNRLGHINQVIK